MQEWSRQPFMWSAHVRCIEFSMSEKIMVKALLTDFLKVLRIVIVPVCFSVHKHKQP